MGTGVLRDPVYGFIRIEELPDDVCRLMLGLLGTPWMQRLGRIAQLGTSFVTYRGATHTRLAHSLGVMWVFHLVVQRLAAVGVRMDPVETLAGYAAALLHDVGHGPYSHALERVWHTGGDHETQTVRIVLEDTDVRRRLVEVSVDLPDQVAGLIDMTRPTDFPRLRPWISSQMDVDRLDYLRRDSRSAGVDYGLFDLDRLLGTLAGYVGGIVPVLSDKGLHIAEQYLLARYHMYWQVYYHKTTRGYERLLASVLARAVEVGELSGTAVDALLSDGSTLGAYLRADDADVVVALKQWATASDEVLADLARRCIDRDLFVCILRHDPSHRVDPISVARTATISRAREALRSRGLPEAYYLVEDTPAMATYGRYDTGREDGKPPVLIQGEGGARPVDEISDPIRSITRDTTAVRVYVPRQCAELLRDQ